MGMPPTEEEPLGVAYPKISLENYDPKRNSRTDWLNVWPEIRKHPQINIKYFKPNFQRSLENENPNFNVYEDVKRPRITWKDSFGKIDPYSLKLTLTDKHRNKLLNIMDNWADEMQLTYKCGVLLVPLVAEIFQFPRANQNAILAQYLLELWKKRNEIYHKSSGGIPAKRKIPTLKQLEYVEKKTNDTKQKEASESLVKTTKNADEKLRNVRQLTTDKHPLTWQLRYKGTLATLTSGLHEVGCPASYEKVKDVLKTFPVPWHKAVEPTHETMAIVKEALELERHRYENKTNKLKEDLTAIEVIQNVEGCIAGDEPKDIYIGVIGEDGEEWLDSYEKEFVGLFERGTWRQLSRAEAMKIPRQHILNSVIVMKNKLD